jgi:hypothetical protein
MGTGATSFRDDRDVSLPIHQHLAAGHMQCGGNEIKRAAICWVFGHTSGFLAIFSVSARLKICCSKQAMLGIVHALCRFVKIIPPVISAI